jgi:hypothetical protein
MSADTDIDAPQTCLREPAQRPREDQADTGKTERDRMVTQAILEDV